MRSQLEVERSSFESQWKENNDFVAPRRGRFFSQDVNRGDRRNRNIIDTTPVYALRTLVSGMMAGITSPSRPWFRLDSPRSTATDDSHKFWLHECTEIMTYAFAQSNLYRVLPVVYKDMATFGTGCIFVDKDPEDVFRFVNCPIGSFTIAQDPALKVNTFFREFQMTANQIVEKFGRNPRNPREIDWSNISSSVQASYASSSGETWFTVIHAIVPNWDYRPHSLEAKFKKYLSCYYELGRQGTTGRGFVSDTSASRYKMLRQSGYDLFPVLAPRWEVTGEDVYGSDCPTTTAIGDIKQLMVAERRGLQAIKKKVLPDLKAPASIKGQGAPGTAKCQHHIRPRQFRSAQLILHLRRQLSK